MENQKPAQTTLTTTNLNEDLMGLDTLEAPDEALPPPLQQEEASDEEVEDNEEVESGNIEL